ncbi:ComF family protein [Candidatus Borkfalkia ceftriaxoniphila]|uniref:ComF family protein n=1 Tax=Candidatus Borkfalkia ceftriaxoniphila TaxID=2508949 RepID=A0A4Q2KBP5_9FIRM|nr:ComF family protein [Candidatus Borkfalkia ceftriaxoniphila]RXZ62004.1 ComF family protein [Candidatus Borkfalkia ceftriaxoniphila]
MPPFFEPMKDFFKRCKEQARGALFPAHYTCEICRKEVFDGASFCPACERALPRNDGFFCKKCGRRILEDFPVCLECKRELPVYTAARSAFVYGGEIVGLVRRFKTGAKYLARTFARETEPVFRAEYDFSDFIVSVPMSGESLRRRGYNQSALLADELSVRLGIEHRAAALVKTRDTAAQKFLTLGEREKNLTGSFRVHERKACEGKTILLVDDVLTTGATANAVSRVLFAAHAARVLVLTVASVPQRD